jgi:molecular chaperone HscB
MPETNITAGMALTCWSCNSRTDDGQFCKGCGKIQPAPPGADYFALLGLPPKLGINPAALEQTFHQLSWKLHPDSFVLAEERERQVALDRSSQLNDAYRTLREPVSRVEYLLRHRGVRKEGASKQQAPPELLEEVFELNESLDELRAARRSNGGSLAGLRHKLEAAQHNFESKLAEVDGELENMFAIWDAALDRGASDDDQQKLLARMNEILNRRSYIRNLVANVQHELAEENA